MTMIFFFLLMLDYSLPPIPEVPYTDFTVTEMNEPTSGGCAANSMNGTPSYPLLMPLSAEQSSEPPEFNLSVSGDAEKMTMRVPSYPDPPQPPSTLVSPVPQPVATPEPPTIAILTVTGLVLLFMLFGRMRGVRR